MYFRIVKIFVCSGSFISQDSGTVQSTPTTVSFRIFLHLLQNLIGDEKHMNILSFLIIKNSEQFVIVKMSLGYFEVCPFVGNSPNIHRPTIN